MELTKKGKLLAQYGKGLAREIYGSAIRSQEIDPRTTVVGNLHARLESHLGELKENHDPIDKKKIINYMASEFMEMGLAEWAYRAIKNSNPKRAKLIKKNLGYLIE